MFDIEGLGGGVYGAQAWRLFMRTVKPSQIVSCSLREGDTNATLRGSANQFCIAVGGPSLDTAKIRSLFMERDDKGLAPKPLRFIMSPQLASEPLVHVGTIDSAGRLGVDEWSRSFHDRCRDCGWGYLPSTLPKNLPEELTSELQSMMTVVTSVSAMDQKVTVQPKGERISSHESEVQTFKTQQKCDTKKWWQFWK